MENENKKSKVMFEKYTWRINNFSKLNCEELYSDKFVLDDFTWYIILCPGFMEDHLAIYLEADKDCANLPQDWKKTANFNLALINQINDKMTISKGLESEFSAQVLYRGFENFVVFNELNEPSSGFIVNDTCMIEAGIFVIKYVYEKNEDKPLICKIPSRDNKNPLFHEMFTKSFKNVDPTFLPLLEEVCLQHPSLVESQKKRGCRFSEWAFTALGQVLHFLITTEAKDMDDETCNHLQNLWDQVKIFGFDLSWLGYGGSTFIN